DRVVVSRVAVQHDLRADDLRAHAAAGAGETPESGVVGRRAVAERRTRTPTRTSARIVMMYGVMRAMLEFTPATPSWSATASAAPKMKAAIIVRSGLASPKVSAATAMKPRPEVIPAVKLPSVAIASCAPAKPQRMPENRTLTNFVRVTWMPA